MTFQPGDFSADGAAWKAVKTVQVTILDDTSEEPDEAFRLEMTRTGGLDYRILFTNADGTANCQSLHADHDRGRRTAATVDPSAWQHQGRAGAA